MTGRNPSTRGARFPFVIQSKSDDAPRKWRGKWVEVTGCNTRNEAIEHVLAQVDHDKKWRRVASYRIRNDRKTVFEINVTFGNIATLLVSKG